MSLSEMSAAEQKAWHELEEAEQAVEIARGRCIAVTNRAGRLRSQSLTLVQPGEAQTEPGCRLSAGAHSARRATR